MLTDDSGFDLLILEVRNRVGVLRERIFLRGVGDSLYSRVQASMTEPNEEPANAPVNSGARRARLVTYMVAEGKLY